MNSRPVFRAALVGFAAALIPALTASAVDWINPGAGRWTDGANWSTSLPPVGAEVGLINNGGTAVIDDSMDVSAGSITLGSTAGTSGNLHMTGGKLTTITTDIRIGGNSSTVAGGTGAFEQSGGTVLMNAGNLNIGFGPSAVGTYNLSGGSLQLNSSNIIAVGNRTTGTINQTGGTIFVRGNGTATSALAGVLNLGRNTTAVGASGTVNLSGGTIAVAKVQFGNAAQTSGDPSTSVFRLSGTGRLLADSITVANAAATNTFEFNGGTLSVEVIGMSLTNNGGNLSPASIDFSLPGANIDELPVAPIGTVVFTGNSSYVQGTTGQLSIDIAGSGSNDFLSIGADAGAVASASISGKISINLLNGYEPALGSTIDILAADSVTSNASIVGVTAAGNFFVPSTVAGLDGREVLRLTVVPEPGTPLLLTAASATLALRRFRRRNTSA